MAYRMKKPLGPGAVFKTAELAPGMADALVEAALAQRASLGRPMYIEPAAQWPDLRLYAIGLSHGRHDDALVSVNIPSHENIFSSFEGAHCFADPNDWFEEIPS